MRPRPLFPARRAARMAAILAAISIVLGVAMAVPLPSARAAGSSWQNGNGTSTTATGQATTDGASPARVFAFDTGVDVTACSSPSGTCSLGQPDGATSFEVFADSASATVSFSVTTSAPIACDYRIGFKVSYTGSPPYQTQTPVASANTCPTSLPSPPVSVEPCPVTHVTGYFEPTQAVWQDDPTTALSYFPDKPGKQLTKTSPTTYTAELSMVDAKPALLFGIDHAQNDVARAPHDRYHIVISGTTNGSTAVPVKMKFSGTGPASSLAYTTDVLTTIYLDGPCTETRPFTVTLPVPDGAPPGGAFTFTGVGGYTLKDELIRADGRSTGIEIDVSGTVVATHSPVTYFVPVRLKGLNPGLQGQSDALQSQVVTYTPDYWPLRPAGFTGFKEPLLDLSARVKSEVNSWKNWAKSIFTDVNASDISKDVLLASLTDALGLGGILGKVGRTVVVLAPSDMRTLDLADANGYTESQKVVFVRSDVNHFTVAHELAHTMPFLWSSDEMQAQCGIDYHNQFDLRIAHGFRVTWGGAENRAPKDPYNHLMAGFTVRWADQCTYWNLLKELQAVPDPPVLLIRGRLAMNGSKVKGQLFPAYETDSATDLRAAAGGRWALVVRDAGGRQIARYPFVPQWEASTRVRHIMSFAYRVPWDPRTARVDLVGPRGVLSTLVWSAHAPTVAITSPAPGATVTPTGRRVHVTWTAHDADGGRLLFTVLYSSDGGQSWGAQAIEQTGLSLDVVLAPGTTAHQVRVVVTDGTSSASSTVTFTTPG